MSNQPSISAAIGNQNLSQSDTREATIEPSILMEIADRERLLLLTLMVKRRLVRHDPSASFLAFCELRVVTNFESYSDIEFSQIFSYIRDR